MRKPLAFLAVIAGLAVLSSLRTAQTEISLTIATGYRRWFHVNSMTVDDMSERHGQIGGVHCVAVNSGDPPAFKKGGPYPEGAAFVDDRHYVCIHHGR